MSSLSSSCEDDEAFLTANTRPPCSLGSRVVTLYQEWKEEEEESLETVSSILDNIDMSSNSDLNGDLDIKDKLGDAEACPLEHKTTKDNNISEDKSCETAGIIDNANIKQKDDKTKFVNNAILTEEGHHTKPFVNGNTILPVDNADITEKYSGNEIVDNDSIKEEHVDIKHFETDIIQENNSIIIENDENGSKEDNNENSKHDDNANITEDAGNLLVPVCLASLAVAIPLAIYLAR